MRKGFFADNFLADPSIFSMEKYHFLWNFYLAIFMDNPLFIKTIRGPLFVNVHVLASLVGVQTSSLYPLSVIILS